MGMFDTVRIDDYWLPEECRGLGDWQTKDFNNQLELFSIDKSGNIKLESVDSPYDKYVVMMPAYGEFDFYTSIGDPNKKSKWYEFTGIIKDGKLVRVERQEISDDGFVNCAPLWNIENY